MISKAAIGKLVEILGARNVLNEKEDLLTFSYDATPGIQHLPDVVVFPTSSEQIVHLVNFARSEGMPIIPRGSGTGLSGGSVAVNGGMILCLNRLNQLLEIDEANLTATAQTGMITLDFFNAVAEKGLFYPPDPASQKISTLGGNISEDAGAACVASSTA